LLLVVVVVLVALVPDLQHGMELMFPVIPREVQMEPMVVVAEIQMAQAAAVVAAAGKVVRAAELTDQEEPESVVASVDRPVQILCGAQLHPRQILLLVQMGQG
jgi:hypothetical protein